MYSRFNDPLEALMMQFEIQDADKSEKGHRLISQCTWLYFGVLDLLRKKCHKRLIGLRLEYFIHEGSVFSWIEWMK